MRSPVGPGDPAAPEPLAGGATSGLTAIDRARHGQTSAVRVLVIGPHGGGRLFDVVRTVGFGATIVSDLEAAIDVLAATNPHCVLIDDQVPEAIAALHRLHDASPGIPVVILIRDAAGPGLVEAGADDWLDPLALSPAVLLRTVESAVARGRARDLRRRLEHADRLAAIGKLAAGVAHEVNNPAAFLLMNLRTCRDHVTELRAVVDAAATDGTPSATDALLDEMSEMLDDNLRGVERIVAIVHALRSYARSEPDHIESVDPAAVVRDACALVGMQIRHRARLELDLDEVPRVAADARKLGQVVVNLLVNAADAVPEGGADDHVVRVSTGVRAGRVVVSVSDTGSGIPSSVRPRIFEPFFTTKPRDRGSGLGLPIALDIVERLGGRIEVTSEPGAGSCFEVVLPADPGSAKVPVEVARAGTFPRVRLLVIDDEVPLTAALQRQLRHRHDLVIANDGATALAILERQAFDVVLCDVMMPHMDGIAVHQAIQRRDPALARRLVFLSGGVFSERTREMVESLGVPLLHKPVPVSLLMEQIDLARHR
jgi:signal transduction histidine kinase